MSPGDGTQIPVSGGISLESLVIQCIATLTATLKLQSIATLIESAFYFEGGGCFEITGLG